MKGLSLYNPHAQLVRIGAKKWETRPTRIHYRGALAIQATATMPAEFSACLDDPVFVGALLPAGLRLDQLDFALARRKALATFVYSAIVAVVEITDCVSTVAWLETFDGNPEMREEFAFGNYSVGRFAWKMENLRALPHPVPCPGSQGQWNVPDSVAHEVMNQLARL